MKITKRQLRRIIKEEYSAILGEDAGMVNVIIGDIQPEMEKMSKTELDLLSMKLDKLIAQLGGSQNEAAGFKGFENRPMKVTKKQLRQIIKEERARLLRWMN
jgi:hypothetical protein